MGRPPALLSLSSAIGVEDTAWWVRHPAAAVEQSADISTWEYPMPDDSAGSGATRAIAEEAYRCDIERFELEFRP